MEPAFVDKLVTDLLTTFAFWEEAAGVFSDWRRLVVLLGIRGVQVHDANHAAAALRHGATHVLTLDGRDFDRFRQYGLQPISAADLQKN